MMHRHFPGALLAELRASCLAALVELAQAFPYQPAASGLGLARFTQVPPPPWLHQYLYILRKCGIYWDPRVQRSPHRPRLQIKFFVHYWRAKECPLGYQDSCLRGGVLILMR